MKTALSHTFRVISSGGKTPTRKTARSRLVLLTRSSCVNHACHADGEGNIPHRLHGRIQPAGWGEPTHELGDEQYEKPPGPISNTLLLGCSHHFHVIWYDAKFFTQFLPTDIAWIAGLTWDEAINSSVRVHWGDECIKKNFVFLRYDPNNIGRKVAPGY